jgi:hypothetical protein
MHVAAVRQRYLEAAAIILLVDALNRGDMSGDDLPAVAANFGATGGSYEFAMVLVH